VAGQSQALAARQSQAPAAVAAGNEAEAVASDSRRYEDVYPKRYKGRSRGPRPRWVDDLPLQRVRIFAAAQERRTLQLVHLP
jgi:hypothetical protein